MTYFITLWHEDGKLRQRTHISAEDAELDRQLLAKTKRKPTLIEVEVR